MADEFTYDVFVRHGSREKVGSARCADRRRLNVASLQALKHQPVGDSLKDRCFIPVRLDGATSKTPEPNSFTSKRKAIQFV